MDKRALSAIPRPVLSDKDKEMLLLFPHMSYLATADRQEVGGADTLTINFFRAGEKGLKPAFRTFCQMDDYITQDLSTVKTKWKTGAINYLTGYLYWHKDCGNIAIASARERQEILGFFHDFREKHGISGQQTLIPEGAVVDSEVERRIDEYQDAIKGWRLRERHNKEIAEIDMQMGKFGALPADYGQFVKDAVFSDNNYIFYSSQGKWAHCTKCGHSYEIRKDGLYHRKIAICTDMGQIREIRHNRKARCPFCNTYLMCKSQGMGRKKLFAVQWSVLVQKHGEEALVRYFCHTKDFSVDFRNPLIGSCERFRTVHTAGKAYDFEWCRFKGTDDVRWCNFKDRSYGYSQPPETDIPRSTVLYNRNLLEDVAGTCMKYSAVDIFVDNVAEKICVPDRPRHIDPGSRMLMEPWCIDRYFNSYRKMPYLEQLLKVGFYKIVDEALGGRHRLGLKNGRTVMETLGVNKLQFNMLRQVGNPSARDVMILRYAGEIRQEEFDMLRHGHDDGHDGMYRKYLDMRQYTTIYKLKKYMQKQKIMHDRDYFDYIRWIGEMGYDMRNEFNLYPRDFKKMHDEKSKEYLSFQDQKAKEEIRRFNKLLKKLRTEASDAEPMNLKIAGLFIRMPESLDELKTEGESLHNCVGTYRDMVARGKTMIFFIRKEADPDKPYYALEWKGKVIQCRGFRNCDMTPEVKAFAEIFQEKMAEYEDGQQKQGMKGWQAGYAVQGS